MLSFKRALRDLDAEIPIAYNRRVIITFEWEAIKVNCGEESSRSPVRSPVRPHAHSLGILSKLEIVILMKTHDCVYDGLTDSQRLLNNNV